MQGKDTNIIVVADKMKAFIGKLGFWVRKLQGKFRYVFSFEGFCGGKQYRNKWHWGRNIYIFGTSDLRTSESGPFSVPSLTLHA
jgi:hypothetical protein